MQENAFVSEETRQREVPFTKMEMFSRVILTTSVCEVESESHGGNGFQEKGLIMSCKELSKDLIRDVLLRLKSSNGMSCLENSCMLMLDGLQNYLISSISILAADLIKLKLRRRGE